MKFLESYRWSSFPDYIGKKNFPSVTSRRFLHECFGGEKEQRNEMRQFIKAKFADLGKVSELILDDDFKIKISEVQPH
jgi:putative transposase